MEKVRVWTVDGFVELGVGQKVLAFKVGAGRNFFGEPATLSKTTKHHLVFVTESGAVVRTKLDNIHDVVGKAKSSGVGISLRDLGELESNENFNKMPISIF